MGKTGGSDFLHDLTAGSGMPDVVDVFSSELLCLPTP